MLLVTARRTCPAVSTSTFALENFGKLQGEGRCGVKLQSDLGRRSRAPLFPVRKTVLGSRRVRVYAIG